ncbi:MAG: hypothetical protein ACLGIC_13255 [Acidimicrobiia bacterium]
MSANGSTNGHGGSGGGENRKRRNRKRRNRSNARALAEFWGDDDALPEPRDDIRITQDPSAVVRSLGRPPLPGQEQAAEAYFAAVYGRAVGLASALAAAGELIEPEELLDET